MEENTTRTDGAETEAKAAATRASHAGGGVALAGPQRFSAKVKLAAVQRLFRGESLEAVSRELNVPAHRLSGWRDRVLKASEGALKERERDVRDEENARLRAKVGEMTMANELLCDKIARLEAGRPLARGRSRA